MTDQTQSVSLPAAALVIRAWREASGPAGLRVRITQLPDLGADTETTTVVTAPEDVYSEVQAWLEEFVSRTASQP